MSPPQPFSRSLIRCHRSSPLGRCPPLWLPRPSLSPYPSAAHAPQPSSSPVVAVVKQSRHPPAPRDWRVVADATLKQSFFPVTHRGQKDSRRDPVDAASRTPSSRSAGPPPPSGRGPLAWALPRRRARRRLGLPSVKEVITYSQDVNSHGYHAARWILFISCLVLGKCWAKYLREFLIQNCMDWWSMKQNWWHCPVHNSCTQGSWCLCD